MNLKAKREKYRLAISNILDGKLWPAMEKIKEIADISDNQLILSRIEQQRTIYNHMLDYFIKNAEDPSREEVRESIKRELLSLSDLAFSKSLSAESSSYFHSHRTTPHTSSYLNNSYINSLANSFSDTSTDEFRNFEDHAENLFINIWMKEQLSSQDIKILKDAISNKKLPTEICSILVSSVTLHILDKFSVKGLMLLLDAYENQHEKLWQRGLLGALLTIIRYDHRLHLYPEVATRLDAMTENSSFIDHLKQVAIQLIRTGDTEKINKRLNEDIIPEMIKMAPKIREKLNLDQLMKDDPDEDKNPDWEDIFSERPDLYNKIEELNKLQSEGADVFITTFSRLKHFPFFNNTFNWLLPFFPGHPDLQPSESQKEDEFDYDKFLDIYDKSPVMCNSDKYSFCMNLLNMPEQQKEMLMNALSGELEEMNKINEDEEMIKDTEGQAVFHQYAQDMYRFFRVHPAKKETEDPFAMVKQLYQCNTFSVVFNKSDELIRHVAEYYFSHNHYNHAAEMFRMVEDKPQDSPELFQKIGYCYQMMEQVDEAISYYKKAELFDTNVAWNLKKIAVCHLNNDNPKEAVKYYKMAEKAEPENLRIKLNIGNAYLELKDYENALTFYRKAEEHRPSDVRTARPVAWCLFLQGENEAAELYYEQILEKETTSYDLMNAGHIEMVKDNREKAVNFYLRSIEMRKGGFNDFSEAFEQDREHLLRLGVDKEILSYVIDAVISRLVV